MDSKKSIPPIVEEHQNVSTEKIVNKDGTVTTSETTTTMKKTTKINYDAAVEAKTFVYETDKSETKYYKALELKNEVAIFITDKGNRPMEIISLKSFEKIMNMMETSYKIGYDIVVYSIYSMEELWEFKRSIKNNTTGIVVELKKDYMYNLEPCDRYLKISQCNDILELVYLELERRKKEKQRLLEEEERKRKEQEEAERKRKEQEELDKKKREQEEEERKKREAEEAEKRKKDEEEAERKRKDQEEADRKKREQEEAERKKREEEEAEKRKREAEEAEKNKKEEEEQNKKREVKKIRIQKSADSAPENEDEKKTKKKMRMSAEEGKEHPEEVISEEIIEENEFVIRKRKKVRNQDGEIKEEIVEEKKVAPFITPEEKPVQDPPKEETPAPEEPKKPVKKKTRTPEKEEVEKEEIQEEKPKKKKIVKKIIKKTVKAAPIQETVNDRPFVSGGGGYGAGGSTVYTGHVCRPHCVICKGLPVRPQECQRCHKQYCYLCTYELSKANHCCECDGPLSITKEVNSQSQTFESNITKITPKEKQDTDSKYNFLTAKDFYEINKDRYVNDSWKKEMEEEKSPNNSDKKEKKIVKQTITKIVKKELDSTEGVNPKTQYHIKEYLHGLNVEKRLIIDQNEAIWSICYVPPMNNSKDGILSGHAKGNIYLWDIDKSFKQKSFFEHTSKVYDIKLIKLPSSYKFYFASTSEDRTTKVWDIALQNSILSISNISPNFCLDILGWNVLLVGDKNKNICLYHINIDKSEAKKTYSLSKPTEHSSIVWRLLIMKKSASNKYVVSGSDKTLFLHELSEDKKQLEFVKEFPKAHDGLIHDIVELNDNRFATCSVDHLIKIWDINKDTCLKQIEDLYDNTIFSLIYLNDFEEKCALTGDDVIVCGGFDKIMKIIGQQKDLSITAHTYGEYERDESLYKMRVLTHNQTYKFAAINYGCSGNLYFWGVKKND